MGGHHHHHHHASEAATLGDERYRATQRVTWVGAIVNLILALVKIIIGYIGQSQALIADGVHSFSDLATDAMVLFASKHGSKEADEDHPYGHARIETASTVALGLFLILVSAGIAWDAVDRMFNPEELLHPGVLALFGALFSVAANEGLYHYTMRVARQIRSNLLKANAWHHRSDAISSIVVIVGVGGSMAGLPYLDAVAAVGVALMIAKIGWDLAWQSLHELVDKALDPEQVTEIKQAILEIDGVEELHMLRTRRMGGEALVDVHILVAPKVSVSEGHYISESVRQTLVKKFDVIQDVLVHIDPEDDSEMVLSLNLPSRGELTKQLDQAWHSSPLSKQIERMVIHYLDGKVSIEIFIPVAYAGDEGIADLVRSGESVSGISKVDIHFSYAP